MKIPTSPLPDDLKQLFDDPTPEGEIDNTWFDKLDKECDTPHDEIDKWIADVEAKHLLFDPKQVDVKELMKDGQFKYQRDTQADFVERALWSLKQKPKLHWHKRVQRQGGAVPLKREGD
jgi:hypothetical protein